MDVRLPVIFLALLASGAAVAQTLEVELKGVQHDRGALRVALYAEADGFLKPDRAYAAEQRPASPGSVVFEFEVTPGRYAVLAYHDEDGNGQLNRRLGMFPTEGYGLSNNPRVMGPPTYEASAFDVAGDSGDVVRIGIDLRY